MINVGHAQAHPNEEKDVFVQQNQSSLTPKMFKCGYVATDTGASP